MLSYISSKLRCLELRNVDILLDIFWLDITAVIDQRYLAWAGEVNRFTREINISWSIKDWQLQIEFIVWIIAQQLLASPATAQRSAVSSEEKMKIRN